MNKEQAKDAAVQEQKFGTAFYPEEVAFRQGFDAGWSALQGFYGEAVANLDKAVSDQAGNISEHIEQAAAELAAIAED